jgi:Peptidase M50B-like
MSDSVSPVEPGKTEKKDSKNINYDVTQLAILVGMFISVVFLWNTVFIYPLKIFVVFLHELSHGIAAVLTGGRIVKIELSSLQGGVCYTSGGARLLIVPAGYLGSMLFGALILLLASKTNFDKVISFIIGIAVFLITILFIRPLFGFGFIFSLVFGCVIIFISFLPAKINDIVLKFIGLTSMLYAILDIKDDLITRTVHDSDASAMSQMIPLPPVVWGIIWILIAIAISIFFLKIALKKQDN